jgi:hypothetical protein
MASEYSKGIYLKEYFFFVLCLIIVMVTSFFLELCHKMHYENKTYINCGGDKMDKIIYNKTVYTVMLCLWTFTQAISTIYTFSWDVKMDWSLFKLHSENFLLRDELGYEHRWIYYCAIVLNFLFRWNWIFAIISRSNPKVGFFIAFGEVFR